MLRAPAEQWAAEQQGWVPELAVWGAEAPAVSAAEQRAESVGPPEARQDLADTAGPGVHTEQVALELSQEASLPVEFQTERREPRFKAEHFRTEQVRESGPEPISSDSLISLHRRFLQESAQIPQELTQDRTALSQDHPRGHWAEPQPPVRTQHLEQTPRSAPPGRGSQELALRAV